MTSYFLGANTPQGFVSEYDILFTDPRVDFLLIIKGSPGCGKSTLMKTVAERAESLGHAAERIHCSSDPDSLDGVVIPDARLAIADGTAPHVLEPAICGLDGAYLDLSRFCDTKRLLADQAKLRETKRKNAACYVPAYRLLRAAGELAATLRALAAPYLTKDVLSLALRQLLQAPMQTAASPGSSRRCFLCGITPNGATSVTPFCRTLWAIEDGCGLSGELLRRLQRIYLRAGYDTVAVCSVMEPGTLAGLLVPELDLGYVRCEPLFRLGQDAVLRLELDSVLAETAPERELEQLALLQRQQAAIVQHAASHLRQAKRYHDALEALYRPAIDFAGVSETTKKVVDFMTDRLNSICRGQK